MLEWLDQNIGSNLATYIGTFIGFISLIYGSSKVYRRIINKHDNSTKIEGGNNSLNIQAGRDIKINKVTKND